MKPKQKNSQPNSTQSLTHLSRTAEAERMNLGNLLHDEIQPLLVCARFKISKIQKSSVSRELAEALSGVDEILVESLTLTRSLATRLTVATTDSEEILPALQHLTKQYADHFGISVNLVAPAKWNGWSVGVQKVVLQSVKELLLNAAKHSKSKTAEVLIATSKRGELNVSVRDWGTGWSPTKDKIGVGLARMRQQVELHGGTFSVKSTTGRGSCFTLVIPPCQQNPNETHTTGGNDQPNGR